VFRLLWGTLLVLTSVYCLLAFLPYTYVALIKSPPYAWMPWFAQHQGSLYLAALVAVAVAEWQTRNRMGYAVFAGLAAYGAYLAVHPFLPGIGNDWAAYRWSLVALLPLIVVASMGLARNWPQSTDGQEADGLVPYSTAAVIASAAALVSGAGVGIRIYSDKHVPVMHWGDAELAIWSFLSQALVALIVVTVSNLIVTGSRRTRSPRIVAFAATEILIFGLLWMLLARFLENAFSLESWIAQVSAASLALSITLWTAWIVLPFVRVKANSKPNRVLWLGAALGLSILAIALPTLVGQGDWNGVLQTTFTLAFWVGLSFCLLRLRPARASYSVAVMVAVLILGGFAFKSLDATAIFWAKPLGATDDEVARSLANYAEQDASFKLTQQFLGKSASAPCNEMCRILREYTNIRDAKVKNDLQLVDGLIPATGDHPNIFIFVIDSLRPDYLGAYNPKADFTPNLDAFARDSVVLRNVYTQYAGTSLSEPAIWAGAMLLHAHYPQPFSKLNSLEKLARLDGYKMVVSYDEVLSQLLSPSDELIKLDTDKKMWNQLEVCSTIQQTESLLDNGLAAKGPILFYTQPKNIHQFARNDLPSWKNQKDWQTREGFSAPLAYKLHQVDGCMGGFFAYLKAHGLYDNSIIILTSDHGDATGELGRWSHSLSIYPEVMRVPLIFHLPTNLRGRVVHDDSHLLALTDITPSLYYLLGHGPIRSHPLIGRPLFVKNEAELATYRRDELFMASDERAVYGLLTENGKYLFATYDSPARGFLFDLSQDPNAQRNVLTPALERQYNKEVIGHLQQLADFYGYKPGMSGLIATPR
jgi:hypothetical protein